MPTVGCVAQLDGTEPEETRGGQAPRLQQAQPIYIHSVPVEPSQKHLGRRLWEPEGDHRMKARESVPGQVRLYIQSWVPQGVHRLCWCGPA